MYIETFHINISTLRQTNPSRPAIAQTVFRALIYALLSPHLFAYEFPHAAFRYVRTHFKLSSVFFTMASRGGMSGPYSLPVPITPRTRAEPNGAFARRFLGSVSDNPGSSRVPHAPLKPQPNERYRRSTGIQRSASRDVNAIGSQSARASPHSGGMESQAHVRAPLLPGTARVFRPGTGSDDRPYPRQSSVDAVDGGQGRMLPPRALELFEHKLTRYERREILDYDEVFFVGASAVKINAPVTDGQNFGFDDAKGDYIVVKGDHIAYRYEVVGCLGKGSFGQVLHVRDHKKGSSVALKLIRNKKRFHQQAMVEIKILDHLRCRDPDERSCTVRMLNYFKFRSHTVITFDMHSINLYELAKLNGYQPFAPALIKRFTAQLLVSLAFMWQEQIVHCDIKPENVLLRFENKTSLKLIDFGSSCFETDRVYTYIQSRFYRAPEVILGVPYGRKIDMWSLGCVICEMQIGFPIFPGENESEQLQCIMEVLGVPPNRVVERAPRRSDFFEAGCVPKLTPNSKNKVRKPGSKDLASVLKTDDGSFVDFIRLFLQWDPSERSAPHEAMHHPWITECFRHAEQRGTQDTQGRSTHRNSTHQLPAIEKRDK